MHLTRGDGTGNFPAKVHGHAAADHIGTPQWHGPQKRGLNESFNGHLMRDLIRLMEWRLPADS